jgi:hypothetical protein
LRDGMSPDEKAKMREKAKNTMNILRDSMSPDEKAKMREKETIGRNRLRDGISPNEKVEMRRKETNDFEYKNIYTGLKILKILTNINPLYVSFVINLLLEQKKITIC